MVPDAIKALAIGIALAAAVSLRGLVMTVASPHDTIAFLAPAQRFQDVFVHALLLGAVY